MSPPIDAAEFDAHKDLSSLITQFLCRNRDKGFSAKEIGQAIGFSENDVNHAMVKLGLADLVSGLTGGMVPRRRDSPGLVRLKIEDVTISGKIYYRCISID